MTKAKANNIHKAIVEIQKSGLTKKVNNEYGGFKYLKISTIMNEIGDTLVKYNLRVAFSDKIVNIGDRYYVRAKAYIIAEDKEFVSAPGYAREVEEKKKMDDAQITGSCSTYARKYALCGVLGLEGEEDVDAKDNAQLKVDKPRYSYKSGQGKKTGRIWHAVAGGKDYEFFDTKTKAMARIGALEMDLKADKEKPSKGAF